MNGDNDEIRPFCEGCPNKPTVHLTAISNGKIMELHLCENCPLLKTLDVLKPFDVKNLVGSLLGKPPEPTPSQVPDLRCKSCNTTFKEFLATGLLGCSDCYDAFREPLSAIIKNIHGSNIHVGKAPSGVHLPPEGSLSAASGTQVNRIERLLNLKAELNDAIRKEDYEHAAQVRDRIHEMDEEDQKREEKGKSTGEGI